MRHNTLSDPIRSVSRLQSNRDRGDSSNGRKGVTVTEVGELGAHRTSVENDLARHGIVLPLPQRAAWVREQPNTEGVLLVASRAPGDPVAAAGLAVRGSRALPGHHRVLVERLGASSSAEADAALLTAAARIATEDRRCLRATIELFERDTARRAALGAVLAELGFLRATSPRSYATTLALDLDVGERELFRGIAWKARRDVRLATKRRLELRAIVDPSYAPRLNALMEETFRRTGAPVPVVPWERVIEWSALDPGASRVSALIDPRSSGSDALVSFAWGCLHGTYVTYQAGASTRSQTLRNIPLGYAPLWDLIAWSCTTPAEWFDFGGVTPGTHANRTDPLGGISDFKRYFCKHVVDVGEDWILEPKTLRASFSRSVAAAARWAGI